MKLKICLLGLLVQISIAGLCQHDLKLWYKQPAANWNEALPIGNGTFGGMVFGKVGEELIQLNEATLWSGGPVQHNVNPSAFENLQPLRKALFSGDHIQATSLARKMQGLNSESYMPLGDLMIKQQLATDSSTQYYRDVNIADAIATTIYTVDGVTYKREIFVSTVDHVMVIKLTANKANRLSIRISAKSLLMYTVMSNENILTLKGKALASNPRYYNPKSKEPVPQNTDGCNGMRYELQVKATSTDGKITNDSTGVSVTDASEIMLVATAATSFNGYDRCPDKDGKDEHKIATDYLAKAAVKSYTTLLQAHLEAYHHYFDRVLLTLNKEESKESIPTDDRLDAYSKGGKDAGLEALYYQYGRYLLISSSQTPNTPANLQGIWNKELVPLGVATTRPT